MAKTIQDTHVAKRVRTLAGWGIALSLLWVGGLGSMIAISNGIKILRLRKAHSWVRIGLAAPIWCIGLGLIGLAVSVPLWLVILFGEKLPL